MEHLIEIPVVNVSRVRLVKADLQLMSELLFHEVMKLIPCNKNIDTLRAVVLDFDGTTFAINREPLFVGKFGRHAPSLPRYESARSLYVFNSPFGQSRDRTGRVQRF